MMAHVESGHKRKRSLSNRVLATGSGDGTRLPDNTRSGVTVDKSLAVYWEHVVAVTDTGCEVLDLREDEDVTFYDHP